MSSERQLLGDSLRRQFELAQAYAAEHDLDLDNMKPDIGLSGWTGANRLAGTLSEFLAKIGTVFRLAKMTPFSGISASKNDPLSLRL